ncbi:pilus assembly protein TadG-related protein [Nakamurella flava]|nr:pilus assembly protein TadG-related protein [Nakamurella flava]
MSRHLRPRRHPPPGRHPGPGRSDDGSIAPLILGLTGALMLLCVGVIAGGSAFLAHQRLQSLCDGAVAAAVGALDPRRTSAAGASSSDAVAAADSYLAVRGPDVRAAVQIGARSVSATCRNRAEVALGAVFGRPTVDQSVTADSEPFQRAAADPPSVSTPADTAL